MPLQFIAAAVPVITKVGSFLLTNPIGQQIGMAVAGKAIDFFTSNKDETKNSNNNLFTRENLNRAGHNALDWTKNVDNRRLAAEQLSNVATVLNSLRNDGVVGALTNARNLEHIKDLGTTVKDVFGAGVEHKLSSQPEMNHQIQFGQSMRYR